MVKLPNSGGIVPVNVRPSPEVFSSVTRSGVPPTVIALQFAMGVLADQFRMAVPLRVSLIESRVSQSDTSPGLLAASDTALPVAQSP